MRRRSRSDAQAMVEFALVGMAFFLLLFGTIEFGRLVWTYHELGNGTREGARYVMVRGRLGSPTEPTADEVKTHILTKVAGLNADALTVSEPDWEDGPDDSYLDEGDRDPRDFVTVSATYTFTPIVGMILGTDPITLSHSTRVVVQY